MGIGLFNHCETMKGLFLKVNLCRPPQEGQQDSKGVYFIRRWIVTWGGLRRTTSDKRSSRYECGFAELARSKRKARIRGLNNTSGDFVYCLLSSSLQVSEKVQT